jgi:hypothetical protein
VDLEVEAEQGQQAGTPFQQLVLLVETVLLAQ